MHAAAHRICTCGYCSWTCSARRCTSFTKISISFFPKFSHAACVSDRSGNEILVCVEFWFWLEVLLMTDPEAKVVMIFPYLYDPVGNDLRHWVLINNSGAEVHHYTEALG